MRKNIKKLYEQRKLCNFLYFFQKHLIFLNGYDIIVVVNWRIAFSNDTLNSRGISALPNITKRIRHMPSHIDTCCIFRKTQYAEVFRLCRMLRSGFGLRRATSIPAAYFVKTQYAEVSKWS